MSNFACEHCGAIITDTAGGYVTGCDHYPIEQRDNIKRGTRFVDRAGKFNWTHKGEMIPGDIDCTDMGDDAFEIQVMMHNAEITGARRASALMALFGHTRSDAVKDYPEIGVCSWREWSQEAAMWMHDPKKGRAPSGFRMWRFFLRQIRSKPLARNPWRRCFARYNMTPWEAKETIFQRGDL